MICPACGNPNAECVIGNFWRCPVAGCKNGKSVPVVTADSSGVDWNAIVSWLDDLAHAWAKVRDPSIFVRTYTDMGADQVVIDFVWGVKHTYIVFYTTLFTDAIQHGIPLSQLIPAVKHPVVRALDRLLSTTASAASP